MEPEETDIVAKVGRDNTPPPVFYALVDSCSGVWYDKPLRH